METEETTVTLREKVTVMLLIAAEIFDALQVAWLVAALKLM
jgi:hypothetical protein